MRRLLLAALLSAAPMELVPASAHITAAAMGTPVPKDQLLKPPADAVHYVVVSEAGRHGDQWRWELPDGKHTGALDEEPEEYERRVIGFFDRRLIGSS